MKKSDKVKALITGFDAKIKELEARINSPETEKTIRDWLKFQSRFHNYSARNTMWMMFQALQRNITLESVAPFPVWASMKNEAGAKVSIKKGSKGFEILFPFVQKIYEQDEKGNFILDDSGKKIPEIDDYGQEKTKMLFGIGYVFDVNQTTAREIGAYKELSYRNKDFAIEPQLVKTIARRITEKYHIPVEFVRDVFSKASGTYYPGKNMISVNLDRCNGNAHVLSTLFHELGHARMHSDFKGENRELAEGQAEAFAFAASSAFGIEQKSELYIKHWIKNEVPLTAVLENISKHVKDVFNDLGLPELSKQYNNCKEQDKDNQMEMLI
jgi:hypothetical protein